jgi:hypothetical protein
MQQVTKIVIPTEKDNIIILITVEHQPKDDYYQQAEARQFDE